MARKERLSQLSVGKGSLVRSIQFRNDGSFAHHFTTYLIGHKFFPFSLQIRNAFFNAVSSACKFNATVLGNYAAVVCPTVLSCLDETDPTVVGSLWECVLHIVNTFEVGFLS